MEQLDALAAQADGIDGEAKKQEPGAVQEQQRLDAQASLAEKNIATIAMVIEMAKPAFHTVGFPSVAGVLTEDKVVSLACVWGAVATKYNVDLSIWGEKYKEEIAACIITYPIAKALYAAIKVDADARVAAAKNITPEKKVDADVKQ